MEQPYYTLFLSGHIVTDSGKIGGFELNGNSLSGNGVIISPELLHFSQSAKLNFSDYLTFEYKNDASYMETTGEKDFILRNRGGAGIRFAKDVE